MVTGHLFFSGFSRANTIERSGAQFLTVPGWLLTTVCAPKYDAHSASVSLDEEQELFEFLGMDAPG
jgi:hypothetical protein